MGRWLGVGALALLACGGGEAPPGGVDAGAGEDAATGDADRPGADGAVRDDGGPDADAGGLPPPPGECRVERRGTLVSVDEDAYVSSFAVEGDRIGMLFHVERPRRLVYGAFSLDALEPTGDPVVLAEIPVVLDTGVVPFAGGFAAAWGDFAEEPQGRVHVSRFIDGALAGDVRVAGTWPAVHVRIGRLGDGLLMAWEQETMPGRHELRFAVTADGETVAAPITLRGGPARPWRISLGPTPAGLGMTWVERSDRPNRAALWFTTVGLDGSAADPKLLVDHERYVYETATAWGAGRFGIATTDSRADILTVPLYFTLLEADGAIHREGIRLTRDFHHEHSDVAFGGSAFAVVSTAFQDTSFGNRQVVVLRHLDREGEPVGGPLDVSDASVRESDCCVRANGSRIRAIGNQRYLVVWNQHEQRADDREVFVVRAAVVGCPVE